MRAGRHTRVHERHALRHADRHLPIDPSACQNGTVLVGGECVDPTTGMIVDLEEGPEPNGLGVLEDSTAPAGMFFVNPNGTYVVHGRITPHGDAPDVDTYRVLVNEPALLEISTDGVGGLAAGFAFQVPVSRLGVDLGSDTARRFVYAHAAGVYTLAVGDMRTMLELDSAAPDANGTGEYYLAVTPHPMPAPTEVLVPSTTAGTLAPGEVAFYQATFPSTHPAGWYRLTLDMPADLAVGALSMPGLTNGDAVEANGAPAVVTRQVSGSALIMVDTFVSLAPGPVDFTLTVEPTVPNPDQ